jgi:SAM-dependent methyltransferase
MNSSQAPHAEAESIQPRVAIPTTLETDQDSEWVVAKLNGHWEEVRIQDYSRLFEVPGLYEHVVYDALECQSPQVIASLLERRVQEANQSMDHLRVLDLGAGNGCVAEEFQRHGTRRFVGVDICAEAAEAADRDRPNLYDEYLVDDMTRPKPATEDVLRQAELNCLCCVAALGFDDIPAGAFAKSLEFVLPGGWVAFTIKSDFVEKQDASGFRRLIDRLMETKAVEVEERVPYTHRFSTDGRPLEYVAYVARRGSRPILQS